MNKEQREAEQKEKLLDLEHDKLMNDDGVLHVSIIKTASNPDYIADMTEIMKAIHNCKGCNKHNHVKLAEMFIEHHSDDVMSKAESIVL